MPHTQSRTECNPGYSKLLHPDTDVTKDVCTDRSGGGKDEGEEVAISQLIPKEKRTEVTFLVSFPCQLV